MKSNLLILIKILFLNDFMILQFTNKYENMCSFPSEKATLTNYLHLPFMQTSTEENENVIDTWNILDQSVSNESNSSVNISNHIWNQINVTAALSAVDHQTWEYFGEIPCLMIHS